MCNVLNQHTKKLILGDFNSWGTNWGSPSDNSRGNTLQSFLNDTNLILLNCEFPTHFSNPNTYTHIDLSFCSPELAIDSEWNTIEDLHGSDHFPILLTLFNNKQRQNHSNHSKLLFKLHLADWDKYTNQLINFNKTWQTLKRNITTENIIKYRKANVLFKRELKIAKITVISTFKTQFQPTTTTTKIWSNIRRLCGLNNIKHIHSIIDPETNLPIAYK